MTYALLRDKHDIAEGYYWIRYIDRRFGEYVIEHIAWADGHGQILEAFGYVIVSIEKQLAEFPDTEISEQIFPPE